VFDAERPTPRDGQFDHGVYYSPTQTALACAAEAVRQDVILLINTC
jgi:hypothetical protein